MSENLYCPSCGAPTEVDQRFCGACGAELSSSPPSARRIGPYRLEREIARGGMGVVYNAYDERLERRVAVKILLGELAANREFRARFVQESRAAALDHSNILPVFDAGEVDGTLYIASRLVDGADLRQVLAREGPLSVERALGIVGQIAAALDFAHQRGIVHRDVKPGNILLVEDPEADVEHVYLIDFGITATGSRDMRLTETGRFIGTPEYISPEQVSEGAVDGRADQYSLACVLFECLTGRSPFVHATSVDVLHAHLHEAPPHPAAVRTSVPDSVDSAVVRALAKSPGRRFDTCKAFVAAARTGLRESRAPETVIESSRPLSEERDTEPVAATGGRSSRTKLIAGVAVAVALVGAGAAVAAQLGGDAPQQRAAEGAAAKGSATPAAAASATPTRTPRADATATRTPRPSADSASNHLVALHPDDVSLETERMRGYTVDLPSNWKVVSRDASAPTAEGVTRRQSELEDTSLGTSLVVDVLKGYDVSPEDNRAQLDSSFATAKPGYRRVGFSSYDLGATTAYEWRYRFDDDDGSELRFADVMFSRGSRLFAVLVSGASSYDDLATLARRVAGSAEVTSAVSSQDDAEPPPVTDEPAYGTYRGVGYQRSATGAVEDDDYRVRVTFDSAGARVSYPDQDCRGTLVADGTRGTRRVYDEQITHGTCTRGGLWTIETVSATKLRLTWSLPDHRYTVRATLSR